MRILSAILGVLLLATGAFAAPPDFVQLPPQANYHATMGDAFVKIGGNAPDDTFVPSVKATKWGEASVELVAHEVSVGNNKAKKVNGKIILTVGNEKHRFYPLNDTDLEYEIEFSTKPSNTYKFKINMSAGVTAYKQLPLTQQEIDDGHERPEDVVNSYAFYYNKKNNKYKTGKVAHLYTMFLLDSVGTKVYCDMNLQGNILTVTMPTASLDNMIYPIILGPTIGYDTQGASAQASLNSALRYYNYNDSTEAGELVSFNFYCGIAAGGTLKMALANANQTTGDPEGLDVIAQVEFTSPSLGLNTLSTSGSLLAATTYALGAYMSGADVGVNFDSIGSITQHFYAGPTYATEVATPVPTTITTTAAPQNISMWVVYGGASSSPRTHLGYPNMVEFDF